MARRSKSEGRQRLLERRHAFRITYSPDADVLVTQLQEGTPRDLAAGVVVHLSAKGLPLEIEILDASKVLKRKDVEVSLGALFPGS